MAVIINIILNIILIQFYEVYGLVFATLIASFFSCIFLLYAIRKKIPCIKYNTIAVSVLKSFIASFIMYIVVGLIDYSFWNDSVCLLYKILCIVCEVLVGVGVYIALLSVMKVPEIVYMKNLIGRTVFKRKE